MFSHLIGNELIKHYLTRMVEKEAIGNSLLFAGPAGVGKTLFALALAEKLLGRPGHPDLHIFRPEGKIGMHTMESMRAFCEEVYLAPFAGKWKVLIVQDADRMLNYSQNALLKTFEEPTPSSIIILVSHQPEHFLPTVLSRCRTLHFQTIPEEEIARYLEKRISREKACEIASLAQGSLGTACQLLEEESNALRLTVTSLLEQRRFADYAALGKASKELAEQIENMQNGDLAREEIYSGDMSDLTAAMKSAIAKEVEGSLRLKVSETVQTVLLHILFWYRDLHLLKNGGNPAYLMHKEKQPILARHLESGHLPSLEQVEKSIQEAKLSFDRSGTLAICLEHLFLKLNFV